MPALATGAVNEDAPHGFSGGPEEVRAILPGLRGRIHQLEPSFVDQRGRLERMARALPGHLVRSQAAQFIVNQRQQLVGRLGVALLDGGEHLRNIVHCARDFPPSVAWMLPANCDNRLL